MTAVADFPFDLLYLATAQEFVWKWRDKARTAYGKIKYIANYYRLKVPIAVIIGLAAWQYLTALAFAVGQAVAWWKVKKAVKDALAKKAGGAQPIDVPAVERIKEPGAST